MELYIVRHGQTVWNVENKVQGRTDIPLNEEGIRQAEKLAEVLKDTPLDLVITSPLSRAWVTGKTVADSHGIPCLTDDRLIEMCFGEFEGTDRRHTRGRNGAFLPGIPKENPLWMWRPGCIPFCRISEKRIRINPYW